jgi:hypothetical protein
MCRQLQHLPVKGILSLRMHWQQQAAVSTVHDTVVAVTSSLQQALPSS